MIVQENDLRSEGQTKIIYNDQFVYDPLTLEFFCFCLLYIFISFIILFVSRLIRS